MEILQNRHSNRIRFDFREEQVQYSIQDGSGSRSFCVPYTDISRDRQTLVERNVWLRNVGLLWIALGLFGTVSTYLSKQAFSPSMWLFLGVGCYAMYHFRSTRFTILPSDKGNLLVIDGPEGGRVIQEIESRRAAQFRSEYDFMPQDETPEQHRKRFRWLHREGALSDEELKQRLAVVDAADPAREVGSAPMGVVLN